MHKTRAIRFPLLIKMGYRRLATEQPGALAVGQVEQVADKLVVGHKLVKEKKS